jgi:hypothetical protein
LTSYVNHSSDDDNDLYRRARKYVELGMPVVLLMENHHPPQGLQQKIAANPRYYAENITLLREDIRQYDIRHISILFGSTGTKDDVDSSLTLHGLDTDGEIFDKYKHKKKIIEDLKTKTMIIKTRKPWGHLVLWFEHSKHHVPLQLSDCIDQFHSFEIKCQNNARADVPPSTHRYDESFRYYHVGLEKVAVLNGLYDRLVDEDLNDCIQSERHPYMSKQQLTASPEAGIKIKSKKFYALSEETISALIPLAGKYYVEGSHDKFTFHFAGMMWHAGISIESAIDVITKLCQKAGDVEKLSKRIVIIKDTYTKGSKGMTIAGTTEFINLLKHLTDCTREEAESIVRRIKFVWRIDAPGPELKQPLIIGLRGNKNKSRKKKHGGDKDYDDDNDGDTEPRFPPPSSAEILLHLTERKIPFLFANQFDECYACILVPNRVSLICYGKEGFRINIDHIDSDSVINHNTSDGYSTKLFTEGYHIETVSISSQKFKEYLMQIYREDCEIQENLARKAMKQSRDRLLEDEVDNHLWKQSEDKDGKEDDENNEGPIILHGKIIGAEAVKNVQTLLSNVARTNGPVLPTYKRVAPRFDESSFYINGGDGAIERTSAVELKTQSLSVLYYALYDIQNRIVEITKAGWTIKSTSENLIFEINKKQQSTESSSHTLLPLFIKDSEIPQTEPSRAYPNDIFDKFMQLTNIKNEEDQLLVKVYIISLFIPEIPRYMLIPYGTYGAAKSFLFKLIKLVVDPDRPLLLTLPKEKEQFVQQLNHSLVLYYDNIEHVPYWFNAEVCSAVTGGGHRKRRLYTDDDDFVYEYMRCLGFNGINIALTKPDSLSRSILIEMAEIDKHRREEERYLFGKLSQIKSQILGYIMDILVKVLNIYPTIELKRKVRMADYAVWGEAISIAIGNEPGRFTDKLEANQNRQHVTAVLATPLGSFMIKFAKAELLAKGKTEWEGQPDDLMEYLTQMIDNKILRVDKKEVPGQSHKLVSELNVIKPNLREGYGIRFENSHRSESGLSEITIKVDKESFEKAINYKSKTNNENANAASNSRDSNSELDTQAAGSERKATSDNEKEMPESKPSQDIESHENNDGRYRTNNFVKNKFGLDIEAEAWDNERYDEEDDSLD